ncbi:MAG: hypothetical protein N4A49_13540 [Marinifilaceae bacterium]|jgi:hypothetical protein|nr:hypothetical protein [Marinifilaceae bacterium]
MKNILKIDKYYLILSAGIFCMIGGIMLNYKASVVCQDAHYRNIYLIVLLSVLICIIKYFFILKKMANKNINRILQYVEPEFILKFQSTRMYFFIFIMFCLGFFLRRYSFINVEFLAIMYYGIGSALFISSIEYFRCFVKKALI